MSKKLKGSFQILHFNDVYDVDRTPAFVTQFMKKNTPETLRLFSGDLLAPAIMSIFEKGRQFIPVFEKIRPQLSVIGNHDLDYGEDHFIEISKSLNTKWLISNLWRKTDHQIIGNALESDIVFINNLKIGVFGLLDEFWIAASELKPEQYEYSDFLERGRELSAKLKSEGCDYVIALTHMSTGSDEALLHASNNIDLILGGHDHFYITKRFNDKLLIKSASNFEYFTKISIKVYEKTESLSSETLSDYLSPEEKALPVIKDGLDYIMESTNKDEWSTGMFVSENKSNIISVSLERYEVDLNSDKDPELEAYVDKLLSDLHKKTQAPLFKLDCDLDITFSHIRRHASKIGMFVADLIRTKLHCDVVLMNAGHLRSELKYHAGSIFRLIDLFRLLPMYDFMRVFRAKGSEMVSLIEQGLQSLPNPSGSFPNLSGAELTVHMKRPAFKKIDLDSIKINGKQFLKDNQYSISAVSFVSGGKDGYTKFNDLESAVGEKEIYPLNVLREFADLPKSEANREEFTLFKGLGKSFSIDLLNEAFFSNDNKVYSSLTKSNLHSEGGDVESLLGKLTRECIERLQMYTKASGIEICEGEFVFIIDLDEPTNITLIP